MNLRRIVAGIKWLGQQHALAQVDLPSEWNQDTWIAGQSLCGSTCCFAGKGALMAGYWPTFGPSGYLWDKWKKPNETRWRTAASIAVEYFGLEDFADEESYPSVYVPDLDYNVDVFGGDNDYDTMMSVLGELVRLAAAEPANRRYAKELGLIA